jgi:uncharacterized membrane protein YGL010W
LSTFAKMRGDGFHLDLETHFVFYGSYHYHPVNVLIHIATVWCISSSISRDEKKQPKIKLMKKG